MKYLCWRLSVTNSHIILFSNVKAKFEVKQNYLSSQKLMKICFKKGNKSRRGGFYRERKDRRLKRVFQKAARNIKRTFLYQKVQNFFSPKKFASFPKVRRDKRISIEYDAFCRAKLSKTTSKIVNKKKRREAFRETREYFIDSIVDRSISRAVDHFERQNRSICDVAVAETFAVIMSTLLAELEDSENCEHCLSEFTLFGLNNENKQFLHYFHTLFVCISSYLCQLQ